MYLVSDNIEYGNCVQFNENISLDMSGWEITGKVQNGPQLLAHPS
jgi:hypothetical protein